MSVVKNSLKLIFRLVLVSIAPVPVTGILPLLQGGYPARVPDLREHGERT